MSSELERLAPPSDATADPYLAREILRHIELRQLVGVGATARVYRALQKGIDRDVAVKVLRRELSSNGTIVARFHREAKIAARLAHPNVVDVLLAGRLSDGAMYIVMEYLDGPSLGAALAASDGALPLPRALHVALQLCDAAGDAHARGIVHRDLKPDNVMLVRVAGDPDFVKVVDFGVARVAWSEPPASAAAGLVFGTARYIPPEGARGEPVGPEGDVYSIATMLYQMLSGATPFDAPQESALLAQQIHDPPPDVRALARASHVPGPIAAAVMRNLSKRPRDRAADGGALGRELLDAATASGMIGREFQTRPSLAAPVRRARLIASPLPRSKPPSSVDPTLAGDEPLRPAPPARAPALRGLLAALCFSLGASATMAAAWRTGALSRGTGHTAPVDARGDRPLGHRGRAAPVEGAVAPLPSLDLVASPPSSRRPAAPARARRKEASAGGLRADLPRAGGSPDPGARPAAHDGGASPSSSVERIDPGSSAEPGSTRARWL